MPRSSVSSIRAAGNSCASRAPCPRIWQGFFGPCRRRFSVNRSQNQVTLAPLRLWSVHHVLKPEASIRTTLNRLYRGQGGRPWRGAAPGLPRVEGAKGGDNMAAALPVLANEGGLSRY